MEPDLGCPRLLADVYEVNGVEAGRYHIAVNNILGGWYSWGVAVFQLTNIFLIGITYTITAATSLVEIAQVGCDWSGTAPGDCFDSTWKLTVIFGAAEILLSQVKNLESAWWVSSLGVVTSLFYSTVALVLGCRYASARQGTIGGIQANHVNKAFGILSALGAIAFAYSFSLILLEIQDTLHQPPKASKTMKPAVVLAISMSFFFYFVVAVTGYSSLGNSVPGFILTGFPDAPRWVIFVSNIMIMLHMISAYQVFTQPMFDTLESHVKAYNLRRAIARGDTEMPRKAEEAIARASARQVSMTTNPVAAPASRSASQTEAGQDTSGTAASAMGRASSSPAAGRLHRTSAAVSENLRRLSRA
ncbi:transmembrane amino acid transporter protein, partial [Helicosporidium sp. ATCC 50920]